MTILSSLLKTSNFKYLPNLNLNSVFTIPFQIAQKVIDVKLQIIDKLFDPLDLFNLDSINSKDSLFKKIAELLQNKNALTNPDALRDSLLNILKAKYALVGMNPDKIESIIDTIQNALKSGKLLANPSDILKKIDDLFNFGALLDTPDDILKKISEVISNLPQLGSGKGLSLITDILNAKASLLKLPSISEFANQLKALIENGKLTGSPAQILEKLRDLFDFGSLLDTPDAILGKISDIISKLPQLGSGKGLDLITDILNAKASLLNLPSIAELANQIKALIENGKLTGSPAQILEKLRDLFDFGSLLDTPNEILGKISELLANLPKLGETQTFGLIQKILDYKADLLGLPSISEVADKIKDLVKTGLPFDKSSILELLKEIFGGDKQQPVDPIDPVDPVDPVIPAPNLGDDQYFLITPHDPIIEALNGGIDTVFSQFDYTLGQNVENLTLLGSGNLTGNGNALDNVIQGNLGNNVLNGYEGNDVLIANAGLENILNGGSGNDALYGSAGNEIYEFELGFGSDVITEKGGTDTLKFGEGFSVEDLLVGTSGQDLILGFKNSNDLITIKDWNVSAKNKVEVMEFKSGDRYDLSDLEQYLNFI